MVFIHNTNLKEKKQLFIALKGIYGLGNHHALQICDALGVCPTTPLEKLTSNEITLLSQILAQNYETGVEIRRRTSQNIQRLISIASYRGFRHIQGLPVRGQRTHGNGRTARILNKKHLSLQKK
jgi:small subunit ribosomal protein S13